MDIYNSSAYFLAMSNYVTKWSAGAQRPIKLVKRGALKRESEIPVRYYARPRHISEMNSAHVDPNLDGTRIYCGRFWRARRSAHKNPVGPITRG